MTDSSSLHSTITIDSQIDAALAAVRAKEQIKNVFLVACGGSYALMVPVQHILQSTTGVVEAHALNSREFTTRAPLSLGEHSLVIACSHSGNTPETVAAMAMAREAGALTIDFTNLPDSPLDQAGEHHIYYQHGEGKLYAYTSSPLLYRLVHGVLDVLNGTELLPAVTEAVAKIDGIVTALQKEHFEQADEWGKAHARSSVIYTLGSGPNYGETYAFAICFLQEMQWIHSQGINSAEFFHGPFEVTDYDVPFIEAIGLGTSRPIDERAHAFVTRKSDDVHTLDAADWDLHEIPQDLRASYAHLVFGPLLRLYAERIADHRGHPLSVRRYMWRSEY